MGFFLPTRLRESFRQEIAGYFTVWTFDPRRLSRYTSVRHALNTAVLLLAAGLFLSVSRGTEPTSGDKAATEEVTAEPVRRNMKLPGLVINFQERCVDLEGTVCLDEGMLELIACTKGSKEHESIIAITAKPMHVHTALLLLGANNGSPAMRMPVDEQETRWIHVPPRGDPVDVYLVFANSDGKQVAHPISDFVAPTKSSGDNSDVGRKVPGKAAKLPNTFLFAGSHLHGDGPGPRQYLADQSGNVISIVTFGDELLCLPDMYSHGADALMWQVDASKLPKVGSKVTLRLRPRIKADAKTDETRTP